MALLYPVVVPCSVILSRIAGDCFTGPTLHSADLNDIGVARFFRCLLTPITAAAHARAFRDGDRRMRWPFVALLLVSGAGIAEGFAYGKKKNRSAE